MKTLIATDIHLHIKAGNYYLAKQIYYIIKRYHDYLGDIILYCRIDSTETKEELLPASDIINDYISFSSLFGTMNGIDKKKLEDGIKHSDLVVGRFHSFSGCEAALLAKKHRIPFLAEVMGDAWDGYWHHGISGKIIAPMMFIRTRRAIKNASFGLYVTENYLQKRYPCNGNSINASNVVLDETPFSVIDKKIAKISKINKNCVSLLTAANVDVRAKGHEYVIKAIPYLVKRGIYVKYYIAGGGDRAYLERIARESKIQDRVIFLGRLKSDEVVRYMDECDIYIQPSLQEGLPRSVIEAMSRGCVCLGAKTAGIPELLQAECVFKKGSEKEIARTVEKILDYDLRKITIENYNHSKKYQPTILDARREQFFEQIRNTIQTESK